MKAVLAVLTTGLSLAAATVYAEEDAPFHRLEGEMQARLAGIDFAVMQFSIDLNNGQYVIETNTESDGVASVVWNYQSAVQATGYVDASGIRPSSYSLFSHYWGRDRTTALKFDDAGAVIDIKLNPLPEEDEREAVPLSLTGGSTDPASIFLSLLATQTLGPEICEFSVKLFDGYRLSQLDGKQSVTHKDYPGNTADFADHALQYCQADGKQIAGMRLEELEKAKAGKSDPEDEQPADIWFAQPSGTDIVLPVRVQKRTSFGLAEFQLQNLRVSNKSDAVLAWTVAPPKKAERMIFPEID